ncbi:MAG: glycosyltransferase family 39 protein, partial [Prevotella sp.]|nr:glycosyltransferase family 39 protein [Prevotella sp.]
MKLLFRNKYFWLLLLVCSFTLLPFLGLSDFHTKGEPREAIVSYTMLSGDNWVLPTNMGGETAYKPPFFHWCVALASSVYGSVTEAASRIPSAVALLIMTMATFVFFAKRKGNKIGIITALTAFTSFEIHRAGGNCRVDMVLTMLTVCAIYDLMRWYEHNMKGIPWIAIVLMGLGTMTKGPVGSIIPCMVMGIFMLMRKMNFFRAFFTLFAFGLLSLLIYGAWFYAAYRQGGQSFLDLMYEENVGRMTNTMNYDSCVNPWPYNFLTVFTGYLPWVLLLITTLFFVRWNFKKKINLKSIWNDVLGMDNVDLYSLIAIVSIFVFYCIPQSKRSVYLMPIY